MPTLRIIKGGEAMGMGLADYIWLDDEGNLLFKKRSILIGKDEKGDPIPLVERWSTFSVDHDCNLVLVPCYYLPDPTRPQPSYIVLCEVRGEDDICMDWNERAKLRAAMEDRGKQANLVWFGFEQDYNLVETAGNEEDAFKERIFLVSERHIGACFDSGILFHSACNNSSWNVWHFKIGVRGFTKDIDPEPANALVVSDHLVIARYLMEKIAAGKGLIPVWLGLDVHVSTAALREPGANQKTVIELLEKQLDDFGTLHRIPNPEQSGWRCVEAERDQPDNPYILAHNTLVAVWPLKTLVLT